MTGEKKRAGVKKVYKVEILIGTLFEIKFPTVYRVNFPHDLHTINSLKYIWCNII